MKKRVLDDNKESYQEKLEQAKLGAFDMSAEFARSIADDETREAAKFVQEQQAEAYGGEYDDLLKTLKVMHS